MDAHRQLTATSLRDALEDAIAQLDRVRATRSSCPTDALPSASYYEAELRSLKASLEHELRAVVDPGTAAS